MALPIITAEQRLAETRGVKGVLVGSWGLGKTSQLWTLDPATTLFVDIEAGDLPVATWPGDSIRPRTWDDCRDIAVLLGGPNPALREGQPFSQWHFEAARLRYGDPAVFAKYQTLFVDSITVAGRLCLQWCKGQPQAFSEKTGKPDTRGAYGLLGQEMVGWLTHLQHVRGKHVWFVGILEERVDDFNRRVHALQIDGAKTGLELPGIVDEVITLAEVPAAEGAAYRAFVCHTANPWGYPAKDRSGRLDMVEPPDLGQLMRKLGAPEAAAPTPPAIH
ncbi:MULTISPECIES: ATP-binding protein [unclassified Lysobacter]|uniref:ATP-binding protein n=1 Tax=unclassified Lysobacter TaxID=2635362 RepID=UPI002035AC35|nr:MULTISPECIES: ATP-binding protein [unclassified Lysobacter]